MKHANTFLITIDPVAATLRFQVTFSGLSTPTVAAHLHAPTLAPAQARPLLLSSRPRFPSSRWASRRAPMIARSTCGSRTPITPPSSLPMAAHRCRRGSRCKTTRPLVLQHSHVGVCGRRGSRFPSARRVASSLWILRPCIGLAVLQWYLRAPRVFAAVQQWHVRRSVPLHSAVPACRAARPWSRARNCATQLHLYGAQ